MANDRLIIIGGVAAGTKAAATARRKNSSANILLLQDEADVSYSGCGLPYHLAAMDRIPRARLIARTPEAFRPMALICEPATGWRKSMPNGGW